MAAGSLEDPTTSPGGGAAMGEVRPGLLLHLLRLALLPPAAGLLCGVAWPAPTNLPLLPSLSPQGGLPGGGEALPGETPHPAADGGFMADGGGEGMGAPAVRRKAPKIFYATRTHSQIAQVGAGGFWGRCCSPLLLLCGTRVGAAHSPLFFPSSQPGGQGAEAERVQAAHGGAGGCWGTGALAGEGWRRTGSGERPCAAPTSIQLAASLPPPSHRRAPASTTASTCTPRGRAAWTRRARSCSRSRGWVDGWGLLGAGCWARRGFFGGGQAWPASFRAQPPAPL